MRRASAQDSSWFAFGVGVMLTLVVVVVLSLIAAAVEDGQDLARSGSKKYQTITVCTKRVLDGQMTVSTRDEDFVIQSSPRGEDFFESLKEGWVYEALYYEDKDGKRSPELTAAQALEKGDTSTC